MIINGSEILLECLLEQNVDTIFGYPGGAVLNIYDAIYKYKDKINHYLTSHEQGAAHAADGYSRTTGKVGVCLATSGPGATNLVTGIATAYMDSTPMIAITGNVSSELLGKDSFQEIDIMGVSMPITKHNFIVSDISKLADTVRKAFFIAQNGRPGPVLIDITKDVTAATYEYEKQNPKTIVRCTKKITNDDIDTTIDAINNSAKPFIYGGGGIILSDASEEFIEFAEKINAPVTLSTMGTGAFPSTHELFTGMVGMHGSKTSNIGITECDLLIAVGARFSDRVISNVKKFAPNAKVIHIDIDPAEIDKNVLTHASIIGDVKEVLIRLNNKIDKQNHKDWVEKIKDLKKKYPVVYKEDGTLKPQYILETISDITKGDAIITTEVGQHQMWACQLMDYLYPRTFITSGGLGTMGFGLGASIGAKVGNKDKLVFNIAGDGCFRMNNIELATLVEYDLPVIVIILNNHSLGMVRQWQTFFYDKRFSHTDLNRTTDFVALAKAYKAEGFNVTRKEEVRPTLEKAIKLKKPVVINFELGNMDNVFPMVPSGAGIEEMIIE